MILKTTTNEFCFINASFYETMADPRHFLEQDYEEMPEYEEESDFDLDSYCNKLIPFVQEWANEASGRLCGYGVNSIKAASVGYPKEYDHGTDWMNAEAEFCDEWRQKMLSGISKIVNDDKCKKHAETNCRSVSGCIFLGPEDLREFEKEITERKSDSGYDVTILSNMYLTLAFVKEFGFKAGEAWSEMTEYACGCLPYSDFATTETLMPEGSEHLFNDAHAAEADESYHHVLDEFGWAWRDPKYKSETESCAMLKRAKEKGLTIEGLSI